MTHSPLSSSEGRSVKCPSALDGRKPPPLPMADAKLGVEGRPNVGEATLFPDGVEPPEYKEPGRVNLEGDRPPGGKGEDDLGGGPEPVNFFCVKVRENIAWDREDCAFISVSLVRRIELPFLRRL